MKDIRIVKIECSTMGHENCKKVLREVNGTWKIVERRHNVYNKLIVERP